MPLGFVIFPLLFNMVTSKEFSFLSYPRIFFMGVFFGLGFFTIFLGWIKEPFLLDDATKIYSFFSYLLIIYCSCFFGIIFCFIKFFKSKIIKFIMIPGLIVMSEFICANFSYGFPWFSFSLVHSVNAFGSNMIFYIGTYSLSYITIIIFLFPTIFLFSNKKYKYYFFLIFLFLFLIIIALMISRTYLIKKTSSQYLKISIVQLNFFNNQYLDKNNLIIREKNIIDNIKENKSDIILFAENDYPVLMDNKNIIFIQDNIKYPAKIIIGGTRKEKNQYFNSLFLIDKNSYQKFDKKILVPFGEFIPFRKIFNFMEFIVGTSDYSKGTDKRILKLNNNINFLPVICYEIIYFWKLLNQDNFYSDIIINLTNDSWFGKFSGPYQHFYFSKLRAAEFNKPLIRISNNGISAFINNYGKIIDYIGLGNTQTKNISIRIYDNKKNYIILHKILFSLIMILIVFCSILNKKNEDK